MTTNKATKPKIVNLRAASAAAAVEALGVHENTLRRWAKEGKIPYGLTAGGQYRYDVVAFRARHAVEVAEQQKSEQAPATPDIHQ